MADRALLQNLKVRPVGVTSSLRLYLLFLTLYLMRYLPNGRLLDVSRRIEALLREDVYIRVNGLKLFVRGQSDDLINYNYARKETTLKWFRPKQGDVVFDVGANVGIFSLLAARSGCRVTSIEPVRDTFSVLSRNIDLNFLGKITPVNMAIGSRDGTGRMSVPDSAFGSATLTMDQGISEIVPVVPLDYLTVGETHIDWLLIDVEGGELDVLAGAECTLSKTSRILIEVDHRNSSAVKRILDKHLFRLMDVGTVVSQNSYWYLQR
jgi:FkbM family methyltransferase